MAGFPENELPLCVGDLLDQQEYNYAKEARGSYDNSRLISKTGSCRLLNFTAEHIIRCFDTLYHEYYFASNFNSKISAHISRPVAYTGLYLAFMGDSRMRQQFLNLIRVCMV